jgi:hypothetical protein
MYREEITITGAMLTLSSKRRRAVQWLNICSLILKLMTHDFSDPLQLAEFIMGLRTDKEMSFAFEFNTRKRDAAFKKMVRDRSQAILDERNRKPQAYARNSDPQTSHDAANAVQGKVTKLQQCVVDALTALTEGTSVDVSEWVQENREGVVKAKDEEPSFAYQSISPRFAPLERMGIIEKTGKRNGRRNIYRLVANVV